MPSNVRMKWYGDAVIKNTRRQLSDRLDYIADVLFEEIKKDIGTPTESAGPSQPGEPPHKASGELLEGLYRDSLDELTRIIGSSAPHTLDLEFGTSDMEARPFLRRALYRVARRFGLRIVGSQKK